MILKSLILEVSNKQKKDRIRIEQQNMEKINWQ